MVSRQLPGAGALPELDIDVAGLFETIRRMLSSSDEMLAAMVSASGSWQRLPDVLEVEGTASVYSALASADQNVLDFRGSLRSLVSALSRFGNAVEQLQRERTALESMIGDLRSDVASFDRDSGALRGRSASVIASRLETRVEASRAAIADLQARFEHAEYDCASMIRGVQGGEAPGLLLRV